VGPGAGGGPGGRAGVARGLVGVRRGRGNRDMLSRRLIRLGNHVTTAANGREAIETLRRSSFDLMLLDIQMPELNGYEVLELVKADPVLRRVPVIVLSATDDAERVVHCIERGAE